MHKTQSSFLGLAIVLAGLCVSSSASATTYTTPFGSSAVEIYIGFRTDTWFEGHVIVWKRRSDGKCNVVPMDHGHNYIYGSSKDDLLKVQWSQETITCSNASYRLAPPVPSVVMLHLKGGSGNDTILAATSTWYAYGEAGNDVIVVVDNETVYVYGGKDNDILENWGTNATELNGEAGSDCMWNSSWFWVVGGDGHDQCNIPDEHRVTCEEQVRCCAFGAFMGACQP